MSGRARTTQPSVPAESPNLTPEQIIEDAENLVKNTNDLDDKFFGTKSSTFGRMRRRKRSKKKSKKLK